MTADTGVSIVRIPLDLVDASPFQIRSHLDEERLRSLAESIRREGQQRPVKVRSKPDGRYELVFGHRTVAAARLAGLREVDAVVAGNLSDEMAALAQRAENRERQDWSDYDLAQWYRMMITRFGYTQDQLARIDGVQRSTVANYLRMLQLEDRLPKQLLAMLTERQARAILEAPKELLGDLCGEVRTFYERNGRTPSTSEIDCMVAMLRTLSLTRQLAEISKRAKTPEKAPFPKTGESVGESVSMETLSPTEKPLIEKGAEKTVFTSPGEAEKAEAYTKPYTNPTPKRAVSPLRPPEVTCPLCGRRGADLNAILLKTEEAGTAELPLREYVERELRRQRL
jgi:ParB/RepB/Spo0J family partition protein